jgi:response regulator RpfG family c-di-GMP phosphodiesterase
MAAVTERPRVLCVDDEPALLEGIERHLRKRYEVITSTSGQQALELMTARGPFAVVVSDMRMPAMSGAVFLARARELAPDTVRMLLTGHADMDSAIAAVNNGQIFRFLTKPCPAHQLQLHIDEGVKHYNLLHVERTLLEKTLRGAVGALTDVLALTSPLAFGRATRVRTRVVAMCNHLKLQNRWHIEVAAMLCDLGAITLTEETAKKYYSGAPLDAEEQTAVAAIGRVGRKLLEDIPRLDPVLSLLETVEAATLAGPDAKCTDPDAQILLLARDCDLLENTGTPLAVAIGQLGARKERYGERAVAALAASGVVGTIDLVPLSEVREGMVFADDVRTEHGTLLVPRGYEVTQGFLARARAYRRGYVIEPLRVVRKAEA